MNVAFDYQIFFSQKYGGISRYYAEILRIFSRNDRFDLDFKVICPMYRNQYLRSYRGEIRISGFYIPKIRFTGYITEQINRSLSSFLMDYHEPAIIHQTYYNPVVSSTRGRKKVVTVYDMIHESFPQEFPDAAVMARRKRAAVLGADHVICISRSTREDLLKYINVPEERLSVIHLGFSPSLREKRLGVLKPYILYVGDRPGYKNFRRLVFAYAKSQKLRKDFRIIAFGGGEFTFAETTFFNELNLDEDDVQQVGGDDSVLGALFSNAMLFVYPSIYEGFGLPPLEAMSLGCPVVCSNAGSIGEVVGEAAGFFDPFCVDSIMGSMESAVFDVSYRSKLIERGFERAKEFSWEECADKTYEIYKAL